MIFYDVSVLEIAMNETITRYEKEIFNGVEYLRLFYTNRVGEETSTRYDIPFLLSHKYIKENDPVHKFPMTFLEYETYELSKIGYRAG